MVWDGFGWFWVVLGVWAAFLCLVYLGNGILDDFLSNREQMRVTKFECFAWGNCCFRNHEQPLWLFPKESWS